MNPAPSITVTPMAAPAGVPRYPWFQYTFTTDKGEHVGTGYASESAARKAAGIRIKQLEKIRP